MVLSVLGVSFALLILLAPSPKTDTEGDALGNINLNKWREYKVGQALGLIALMTLYAFALRPVGFIAATTLFLVGAGWTLGERKWLAMIGVALTGALCIWYLVQEALGIFLRPLPWFLS
jgi:putative tricarboxylic transport membrane protein